PGRVDTLVRQLDVAPTVLGLLGISYDSVFFGRDALVPDDTARFALLNHNRDVALFQDEVLRELHFRKGHSTHRYDRARNTQYPISHDEDGVKNAAAILQVAYGLYASGRYRVEAEGARGARPPHARGAHARHRSQ